MILGIGQDVVETERVARAIAAYGCKFQDRIYTAGEQAACSMRADRAEALAGRFAAKEAFFKALGTGVVGGLSLLQAEVVDGEGGRPLLRLTGEAAEEAQRRGVRAIHLSLSHQSTLAAAVVILEG
jgi:holo-[acyl-carrier protein] synthase